MAETAEFWLEKINKYRYIISIKLFLLGVEKNFALLYNYI